MFVEWQDGFGREHTSIVQTIFDDDTGKTYAVVIQNDQPVIVAITSASVHQTTGTMHMTGEKL